MTLGAALFVLYDYPVAWLAIKAHHGGCYNQYKYGKVCTMGCLRVRNILLAMLLLFPWQAWSSPLRVLIDVRSTHSDGAYNINTLVDLAKKRDIQALAVTDHDRKGIRFGIEPIPGALGYTKDLRSLYTTGLPSFFANLAQVRRMRPDMILFAGTESIPGYTWSGIPFRNLTLHNSERMMITLGEKRPRQVETLPSYSLENIRGGVLSVSIAFWSITAFIATLLLLRRRKWIMTLLLLASYAALIGTLLNRPAIHADTNFIARAHGQGLFVIWAYPGTHSGVRPGPMGVHLDTPPYSRRVFRDPTADAFAAVYGDTDTNTEPGGLWDRYMKDYMQGLHDAPLWGVAAGDFHKQGEANEYLGNFPMDVWTDANKTTPDAILTAMRKGHMVSWHMPRDRNLRVKSLFLEDVATGRHWLPGDTLTTQGKVILHCSLGEHPVSIIPMDKQLLRTQIIVDGYTILRPSLGLDQPLLATLQLAPGAHVIRLRIPSQSSIRMEANPFLVWVPG